MEGGHVGGLRGSPDRLSEAFREPGRERAVCLPKLDTACRRGPHEVGPGVPEEGGRGRGPPGRQTFVARAAGVPGFGETVDEDGLPGALGSLPEAEDGPRRPFPADLLLQQEKAVLNGLGPGRASGDVDVDGEDLVHSLEDAVDVVHAAAVGAGTHGDDPLGFGHLFVEAQDHGSDLLEDRPRDNEEVGLAGGASEHLGAEAGEIVTGREDRGHLDEAAGGSEEERPLAVPAGPVDHAVEAAEKEVPREVHFRGRVGPH